MIPPFWRWKTKIEEVRVKLDDHVFYREQAGVISKDPLWVFLSGDGFMYMHESFPKLVWTVLTEWENDHHMVG